MDKKFSEEQARATIHNRFDIVNTDFFIYQCSFERTSSTKAPRHGSNVFSLHYIVDGELFVEYGGKQYTLGKNTCFLLRPGRAMKYYPNPEDPVCYYWFSVTGGMVSAFFGDMGFSKENFYVELTTEESERIRAAFFRTITLSKERPVYAHFFLSRGFHEIAETMALLMTASASEKDRYTPLLSPPIVEMIEYVGENYQNPDISLQKTAKSMGYNPAYLSRLFKDEVGVNFSDYVRQKRVHYAADLIRRGEKNMAVVAEKVGIRDPSYLTKLFKKYNDNSSPRLAAKIKREEDTK